MYFFVRAKSRVRTYVRRFYIVAVLKIQGYIIDRTIMFQLTPPQRQDKIGKNKKHTHTHTHLSEHNNTIPALLNIFV